MVVGLEDKGNLWPELRDRFVVASRAEALLTKMPLLHIDDRIRYVRALRDQKLVPGGDAAAYVERLILHYEQFPIPEEYTTTHYVPNPDGSPRLMAPPSTRSWATRIGASIALSWSGFWLKNTLNAGPL